MSPVVSSWVNGHVVRQEGICWVYYADTARIRSLVPKRCGKWMHFTGDFDHAEELVREAVLTGAVICAKRGTPYQMRMTDNVSTVCCFYLNGDDAEAHRRALRFMLEHDLVPKSSAGRLANVPFKYDEQTRAGEYGDRFRPRVTLSDFVNLDTGEFLVA